MPQLIYLFIPGIMGSSLRFRGLGVAGEPIEEEIWGEDACAIQYTLAERPEYLSSPDVYPDKVISEIRTSWWGVRFKSTDVYGSLLRFCVAEKPNGLGLKEDENFFPFAYDWRADNLETAKKLAEFLRDKFILDGIRLRIIAHSMGGIVARLMLSQERDIATRTDMLFQIASPVKGSAKSYFTLKAYPRITPVFDKLLGFHQMRDPGKRDRLQSALRQCPSIYQLLPPSSERILSDEIGRRYATTDWCAWDKPYHAFLKTAKKVHRMLSKKLEQNIQCIYSTAYPTESEFVVDRFYQILCARTSMGDATIVGGSAIATSSATSRFPVNEPRTLAGHQELCQNPKVFNHLKKAFQ